MNTEDYLNQLLEEEEEQLRADLSNLVIDGCGLTDLSNAYYSSVPS